MLGISKRALLEDYYPDELAAVFEAWAQLQGTATENEHVDTMEFLNL